MDFNEFMTILGPKLLSSETREGFLGSTIDTIFWQVKLFLWVESRLEMKLWKQMLYLSVLDQKTSSLFCS